MSPFSGRNGMPWVILAAVLLVGTLIFVLTRTGGDDPLRDGEEVPPEGAVRLSPDAGRESDEILQSPTLRENQVAAKVRSWLEVREGELGMLVIPAEALDSSFGGVSDTGVGRAGQVLSVMSPDQIRIELERLVREGVEIGASIGDRQGLKVEHGAGAVEASSLPAGDQETQVTLTASDSEGKVLSRSLCTMFTGQCLLLSGEGGSGVLLISGRKP
ncbi:MAG: hypothetical protein AAGB14_07070 [Verrucomicrobiota bacterium]